MCWKVQMTQNTCNYVNTSLVPRSSRLQFLIFCILQAIKNWSWGRPGNEATWTHAQRYQLNKGRWKTLSHWNLNPGTLSVTLFGPTICYIHTSNPVNLQLGCFFLRCEFQEYFVSALRWWGNQTACCSLHLLHLQTLWRNGTAPENMTLATHVSLTKEGRIWSHCDKSDVFCLYCGACTITCYWYSPSSNWLMSVLSSCLATVPGIENGVSGTAYLIDR